MYLFLLFVCNSGTHCFTRYIVWVVRHLQVIVSKCIFVTWPHFTRFKTLFKNLYGFWCFYYTFYTMFTNNSLRTTVPKSSLDSTSISLAGARNESYF